MALIVVKENQTVRGVKMSEQLTNIIKILLVAFILLFAWNEAYGNVVVEAMACGVPVVAYDRGGPGELMQSGLTGFLVPANDVSALTLAASRVDSIDRRECRNWVQNSASHDGFARRVESWLQEGIKESKLKVFD